MIVTPGNSRHHVYQREQVATIRERMLEPPQSIISIFGPRQTGKTTAVRQALESVVEEHGFQGRYEAVDAVGPLGNAVAAPVAAAGGLPVPPVRSDARWLVETWDASRQRAWNSRCGFVLVLDEIQVLDDWSVLVKGLWDEDRASGCPLRVVILGSATLRIQTGLQESLAGRFEPIRVTHWSYPEMSRIFGFSLEEYIYYGGYPATAPRIGDWQRWLSYVQTALVEPVIERDIVGMTRVDKPELLKRLFEVGAIRSGQIVQYNKLLGEHQGRGNAATLKRYLGLLGNAGLLAGLGNHAISQVSAKPSHPKLNVLNTALMSSALGRELPEIRNDRESWGRLVESSVGAHLINTALSCTKVRYWRYNGYEVDFVLLRGSRVIGVEVKSGSHAAPTSGMSEFENRCSPYKTLLVDGVGYNARGRCGYNARGRVGYNAGRTPVPKRACERGT